MISMARVNFTKKIFIEPLSQVFSIPGYSPSIHLLKSRVTVIYKNQCFQLFFIFVTDNQSLDKLERLPAASMLSLVVSKTRANPNGTTTLRIMAISITALSIRALKHIDIQHNSTQHIVIQHNNTAAHSITALSILTFSITINKIQFIENTETYVSFSAKTDNLFEFSKC
jgi:hypothetical protein